ncbi:PREDICTED: FK506-binding protein 4-like [Fragaria vesca subsp. vesca]|uniref:FK506-binding protein 4-like n=1 Tax=Fragaria vesca subsp. vesca TaxID=101020 RepID=UPI0002C3435A|nr:PREDICTED: FK506-binding protein 4-like [Fragaria vesca subsp. vesca]
MGEKKVTIMVLKVDLQCEKCYKKVKKVLCKFPQIRDQTYDEKNNQVIIKVVCCSPEKIRDKLCCKGGGAIKSIDIKEPEKPKEKPKEEKPKAKPEEKKKEEPKKKPIDADKPKGTPKEAERPKDEPKKAEKPKEEPVLFLVPAYPPVTVSECCMDCYGGHPGGPCQTGYGYGGPVYDSYGGGRSYATSSYCMTRPDCFGEENPQACAIM